MAYVKVPLLRGFTEIKTLFEEVSKRDGIICGGYARYCASQNPDPVPATDVDVFPVHQESFEGLKKFFTDLKFEVRHENDISLTYKRNADIKWLACPYVQIIKPTVEGRVVTLGDMEKILSNFDFSIVRAGILSPEEVLVDEDFIEDEKKKIITIKNIHCPISSTFRVIKYTRRGYWAKPSEVVKLFVDWDQRDNEYRGRIIELFKKGETFDKDAPEGQKGGLSKEEIDELEAIMRID
jgi:hypothetical protein